MRSDEKSPNEMGFLNVKLMIPFAEPEEGEKVLAEMAANKFRVKMVLRYML
jgi:hypothetical protein